MTVLEGLTICAQVYMASHARSYRDYTGQQATCTDCSKLEWKGEVPGCSVLRYVIPWHVASGVETLSAAARGQGWAGSWDPTFPPCQAQDHQPWAWSTGPWEPQHPMCPVLLVKTKQELLLSFKGKEQVLSPPYFFWQETDPVRVWTPPQWPTMAQLFISDHTQLHSSYKCTWPFQVNGFTGLLEADPLVRCISYVGDCCCIKRK